jgi:hypothetical protein
VRWKLFTLDNRIIGRRLGGLERNDRDGCAAGIAAMFAIAS